MMEVRRQAPQCRQIIWLCRVQRLALCSFVSHPPQVAAYSEAPPRFTLLNQKTPFMSDGSVQKIRCACPDQSPDCRARPPCRRPTLPVRLLLGVDSCECYL